MTIVEALQSYFSQRKSLLNSLGFVDPSNTKIMNFDLDKGELRLPSSVAFQVLVTIKNIIIHWCSIDEGASMCVVSSNVWKRMGSPKIVPSSIALRAYDGIPSQPYELYQNVPIKLGGKG